MADSKIIKEILKISKADGRICLAALHDRDGRDKAKYLDLTMQVSPSEYHQLIHGRALPLTYREK